MTRDLSKLLADYVEDKLDPETEIEIDGLILLYVDGELDSERAAEIRAAMGANPAVAASIEHSIRAAKTVQEQLMPAEAGLGKLPPDPAHDQWLTDLIADPNAWGKAPEEGDEPSGVVVPLQARPADEQRPARPLAAAQPTWGALAASIAVLLALGGGAYVYDQNRDMQREEQIAALDAEIEQLSEQHQAEAAESDRLTRQVTALGIQLSEATTARDEVRNQLAEAETAIDALKADQVGLMAELAAADEEVATTEAARDDLQARIASLDAQTRQTIEERVIERDQLISQVTELENRLDDAIVARDDVMTQLAAAKVGIEGLDADRAELAAELADVTEKVTAAQAARDELDTQLADARAAIEDLNAEKQAALSQVAALETDLAAAQVEQVTVQAQVAEGERRIDALDEDLDAARVDIAEAEQANALLTADRDQQLQQATAYQTALETLRFQTDWLAQVAGYHIGYAGKPREVEVKVDKGFDETTREAALKAARELSNWLSKELDHQIKIPTGLPMEGGLEFIGGRVLPTISGTPVGQIAYHDDQGRLTAFCIKRNPTGTAQDLERRQFFGRLQMIHWQDQDFQYVVVGFADFEALQPAAEWLQENYGDDT